MKWLAGLPVDANVAINDSGLTLCEVGGDAHTEVGGVLSEDELDEREEDTSVIPMDTIAPMKALVVGNPFDGMKVFGPFSEAEDANKYGEDHYLHDERRVVALNAPEWV